MANPHHHRVTGVEVLARLAPISGWEDQPLVTLPQATEHLPVKNIKIHAQVALEVGEDYKEDHPDDPRSEDQLGSVHLYSQGWAHPEHSLYAVLNETLSMEDRSALTVWFLFIKLLMTALVCEPMYVGTIWRGVKADIGQQYVKGKKIRWWRFTSCTKNGEVLDNPLFLGTTGKRTLFSIDCQTGVEIQHLSAYATEAEVLLAAGTRFQVANTIVNGDLTIVNLKEVASGLPPREAVPSQPQAVAAGGGAQSPSQTTPPITKLAQLSAATDETEADLLQYSDADLDAVFTLLKIDIVGKKKIQREMVALKALLQTELELEPEPEPVAQPVDQPKHIYVMGGYDGSSRLDTAEKYDPATDRWTPIASMGSVRYAHASVVINGFIYVMGGRVGYDGSSYLDTAEKYDPATDRWTPIASMGSVRYAHASVVSNGFIYVMGGYDGSSSFLDTAEKYDPVNDRWTPIASMDNRRSRLASVALNGFIYVMGGYDGSGSNLDTAEKYDPVGNRWTPIASMGSRRYAPASVALNGFIYVMGGQDIRGSRLDTAEKYDPEADRWTPIASMGSVRLAPASVVINGFIYVMGGYDGSTLDTAEKYDPEADRWTPIASMGSRRQLLASVAL
eukprot:COSAG02_NODE_1703_length_11241_cov_845.206695_9_plen_619_part_00